MPVISVFDFFKIGVGPSSSHTVGPMKAARQFVDNLADASDSVARIEVTLYGSLGLYRQGPCYRLGRAPGIDGVHAGDAGPGFC
jgi:L-serine dehydratase